MAKLLLLVLWTTLGFFISEASLDGNLCRTKEISLSRQPVGSLHFIVVPNVMTYCTIKLNAQWGFTVVLSITRYSVPDNHLLSIEDSDGYRISLLGHGWFPDNKKSFMSERSMTIRYVVDKGYEFRGQTSTSTINETELNDNSIEFEGNNTIETIMNGTAHSANGFGVFDFTYTQVGNAPCVKSEFTCQNGKCLPEEYVCSGHNRCGDNSDNNNCGPRQTKKPVISPSPFSNQTIILICTAILVLALFITAYIIVCVGKSRKAGKPSDNSSPPLQSVSSSVDAPPDQSPRVPEEETPASMCSRVQHFFRQQNEDKVEGNLQTLPSERFEVPSMYPSLQPSAPEFSNSLGRENRGFSGDRE